MTTSLRRSGARTRTAALLTSLALAAGVSACSGDGGDDTATDPDATSSTPSPSQDPPSETPTADTEDTDHGTAETVQVIGSAGITSATMVHATDAGGSSSTLATALDTDQAVDDFVAQFEGDLGTSIGAAIGAESALAPDATPYGATVAVGCDAPRSVAIDAGEAGFEVVPQLPKNTVQCFAPMTFVVVFTSPDA